MNVKTCAFVLAALFSSATYAEIYKWTDENGKQHFSDVKPAAVQDAQQVNVREGSFVEQDQAQLQRSKEFADQRAAERERERAARQQVGSRKLFDAKPAAEVPSQNQLGQDRHSMRNSPHAAPRARSAP